MCIVCACMLSPSLNPSPLPHTVTTLPPALIPHTLPSSSLHPYSLLPHLLSKEWMWWHLVSLPAALQLPYAPSPPDYGHPETAEHHLRLETQVGAHRNQTDVEWLTHVSDSNADRLVWSFVTIHPELPTFLQLAINVSRTPNHHVFHHHPTPTIIGLVSDADTEPLARLFQEPHLMHPPSRGGRGEGTWRA